MLRLCKQAISAGTKEINMDWPFVVPLYHFMSDVSKPFMTPEYNPEKIKFDTKLVDNNWKFPQG